MAKKKMSKSQAASVRWEDTPDQERPMPAHKPESIAKREQKRREAEESDVDAGSAAIKKTFPAIIIAAIVLGFVASFIVIAVAGMTS